MRLVGGGEKQRHVIVDGNNLVQRAYFVFEESRLKSGQPLLSGPNGYPIGIIQGSLSFLCSWMYQMSNPTKVSVVFDGLPMRRRSLDPTYKTNRDNSKHDMRLRSSDVVNHPIKLCDGFEAAGQMDVLAHVLQLLGCDVYHHMDEEADDIIATLVRREPESIRIVISDDKDFFQLLVDPRVVLFRPGSKDTKFFDAELAQAHWAKLLKGKHPAVPCSQVRMFKTLCGDHSDGIVGVPLLRKRAAIQSCHFATIDELYASGFPGFNDSEKRKALELQDRIRLNWELVGLKDDLDLSVCLLPVVRPVQSDYSTAVSICQDQLLMRDIDFKVFRPKSNTPVESIPIDSWLLEV